MILMLNYIGWKGKIYHFQIYSFITAGAKFLKPKASFEDFLFKPDFHRRIFTMLHKNEYLILTHLNLSWP